MSLKSSLQQVFAHLLIGSLGQWLAHHSLDPLEDLALLLGVAGGHSETMKKVESPKPREENRCFINREREFFKGRSA